MNSQQSTVKAIVNPDVPISTSKVCGSRASMTSTNSIPSARNLCSTPTFPIPSERQPSTQSAASRPRRRFKSSRLTGEYPKPWLDNVRDDPDWEAAVCYISALLAFCAVVYYTSIVLAFCIGVCLLGYERVRCSRAKDGMLRR
ncbi:uncharacterized protein K444DRAFT_291454 [Hyaloscypha bicolor E]|uniref:Uncharacterized protein n=1 Tax=Hyaloscypha bicolor E TaxID=1095630 RepID=A0A2J6SFT2_9HELO|nr:uncharacterized protein K444DRAFT_291454 [Hyaloscypha bicolor E]PMD49609.1 hypothetical protein K444DRAFT_291454 [Hyaloscypha bicolor E]